MNRTWLYLYENLEEKSIYIGIGETMGRVFQPHNAEAERLRDAPGTLVRQTAIPFSTRTDASIAEAVAIHVATIMGLDPKIDECDMKEHFGLDVGSVTNIQGTKTSKFLTPALYLKDGEVHPEDLTKAIVVPIKPEQLPGRVSAFGGVSGEEFAKRATRFWNVAKTQRNKIDHLIAVLTGSRNVILGSWKVRPDSSWELSPDHDKKSPPYNTRVTIPIESAAEDDYKGIKGMTYTGKINVGVAYSPDIKNKKSGNIS